jgi:hypothetical protein
LKMSWPPVVVPIDFCRLQLPLHVRRVAGLASSHEVSSVRSSAAR